MERKITTVNLDEDLKRLMDSLGVNRSDLVNQLLRNYFASSKPKEIDNKIQELQVELSALEHRKKTIEAEQEALPQRQEIANTIFQQLYTAYCRRRADGMHPDSDHDWITGPKNAQRCSSLGLGPVETLAKLQNRWGGEQKNLEAYR